MNTETDRRQFLTVAAGVSALSLLAACGGKTATSGSQTAGGAGPPKKGLVHYANVSNAFYFYVVLQESIKRASEAQGWQFGASNANFVTATELNQIQTALLLKPIALTMDTTDSEGLVSGVQMANAQKVPVGLVDVPVAGGKVAITVTTDNRAAGVMAAQKIVDLLIVRYGSPRGVVLNAYGAQSALGWRLRKEGWDSVMKNYPRVTNVELNGDGDLTKTYDATVTALAQYPNLDAAHAPSDYPAIGIVEALKANGKLFPIGDPKHVILVTIDGDPVALDWIRGGLADGVMTQDPIAMGTIVIDKLATYSIRGKAVPLDAFSSDKYYWKSAPMTQESYGPHLIIPPYFVDKSNVEDPRNYGNVASKIWKIPYTMPPAKP